MLRRVWLSVAVLALAALAGTPAATAAPVSGGPDDAIVVLAGDVVVGPRQEVEGVYVASGDVLIRGHVSGDVIVLSGDVTVRGTIDGDLFTASGTTRVQRARIGGDVIYADEHPEVSGDTVVGGEVKRLEWPDFGGALPFLSTFVIWLALTVSLALLGSLAILVAPRAADSIAVRSRERAGPTIAIGLAIAIALPVTLAIAAVTVVGLPFALLLGLSLLPLGALAFCASAYALGRRVLGPPRERILSFLVGLGILQLAGFVPFLDLVVGLAATVFGLGLLGAAIGAARKPGPDRSPDS